jgi:hypothetical protein
MSHPAISVLVYTARRDHPFVDRRELHCYDAVTASLQGQTFGNFELVLIDALWEQRGDWFKEHPQPYPVKHVPASPNIWHAMGRPGLVAQLNRGLAWCGGDLVFVGSESTLWPPHFMQQAWDLYQRGQIGVAWYAILAAGGVPAHAWCPRLPIDCLGYSGDNVCDCDHRGKRFVDDPQAIVTPCHHQHYFAYSALPMDLALELNGFDEAFDGDVHLFDVDLGSRIEMAGRGGALVMHRNLWCAEAKTDDHWLGGITRRTLFKCGYAQWWYNRLTGRTRANTRLPDGWIEYIKREVCGRACPIMDSCAEESRKPQPGGEGVVYPFCAGPERELTEKWLAQIPVFELGDEIDKRRRGVAPYDRSHLYV